MSDSDKGLGKVIDFNKRLFQKLVAENQTLRTRLRELLELAQENERIQRHLDSLEEVIHRCSSLDQLARTIIKELRRRFKVEFITLCLVAGEGMSLKEDPRESRPRSRNIRFLEEEFLVKLIPKGHLKGPTPILKKGHDERLKILFSPHMARRIHSWALIPLQLRGKLIGILNLGSSDPKRYSPDMGTDFLRRLGSRLSILMDNIISHQRLVELSEKDPLTSIYNRRYLEKVLRREFDGSKRYGSPLSCILIDLDGFKEVNDRFGHHAGDMVLKEMASILLANSRGLDTVARYGGDEFVIVLRHTPLEGARVVASKFQEKVKEHNFHFHDIPLHISLSMGLAGLPYDQVKDPKDLIDLADRRLYLSKQAGGSTITWQDEPQGS